MGLLSYQMVKLGYLFPGQGAQYVGMGKDFYEAYPEAKELFGRADSILGFPLTKLCFEGPQETLTQTSNAQPAIFTASLAALEVLKQKFPELKPSAVCGLSLGEWTALVAAGAMSFEDGLRLVRARGTFMEEAGCLNPGTMASVIGLPQEKFVSICEESGAQIANFNSREQIVLSGTRKSVAKACELANAGGAKKVIPLNVSGAFHSDLMKGAQDKLRKELEGVEIKAPVIPFIPNVAAHFESDPARIRKFLYRQVTESVQWVGTMEFLHSRGIQQFIEIGPGKVLRGLARKINPEICVQNLDNAKDIDKLDSLFTEKKG